MKQDQRNEVFTVRLLKGGALLDDMRRIVLVWNERIDDKDAIIYLARFLPKPSLSRVKDIYKSAFRPRFINGSPSNAWKLAKILEAQKADIEIIRPFYYWITARAEATLYEFASDFLFHKSEFIDRQVRIREAIAWLSNKAIQKGISWTPYVTRRMTQGILSALRDFGILEGFVKKQISSFSLPLRSFSIIAFCLYEMGLTSREIVNHPDWRLFLLSEEKVERYFLECHQHGWLKYESAGSLKRLEFPQKTFAEYSYEVLK